MNLSIVSFLAWGLQEAKLFFNSQSILEQNKNKLDELITQVTEKLGIIEQDWNQQERTDNNENIRLIQDVRDILAQSSQLRNQLPNQPNMLSAYQMSREQINQELLQSLKMLEEYNNKIDQFIQHTRNITKTVIILRPKQAQNSQIYQIQIKLKLKAPPSIKKIFDDQPYYLKSEYKFNFEMEETGSSNKNVKTFIRDDFSKLGLFQSKLGLSIENLSKQNHCSLQMRYKVLFQKQEFYQILRQILQHQSLINNQLQYHKRMNKNILNNFHCFQQ
ncbi:unnamed protein product [Paramecium octaurelia]|uniref:Uncharacterized protein n=1 Tax=Paramecium octaurelia TaxID=43137 RepID=A0A8S1S1T5_PAROT|nr:unnamed protein product [Paramecium octaurelia]